MNICISIGHGKSAKGGYDSGALGGNYQEFKIGREIGRYIGEIFKGYACTADVINYDATLYLTERIAQSTSTAMTWQSKSTLTPQAAQARRSIISTRARRVRNSRRQSARALLIPSAFATEARRSKSIRQTARTISVLSALVNANLCL